MVAELSDIAQQAYPAVLACAAVGSAAAALVYCVRRAVRTVRKIYSDFEDLKKDYKEGMTKEELIAFCQRLYNSDFYFEVGRRKRELRELKEKVEAQLEPIIEKEIREAELPERIDPQMCIGDLSDTYKRARLLTYQWLSRQN
jgi:hypothetical protein